MPLTVAILSVGDELTAGDLHDSNAPWIASTARARGHRVAGFQTVPDDVASIARAIDAARATSDLLVVSGGLGPTIDDLTRDGVAAALDVELAERAEIVDDLRAVRGGREPSPASRRQAEIPVGAELLVNERGTAPGFLVTTARDDAPPFRVACVPGVPSEMREMVAPLFDREWAGSSDPRVHTRKFLVCAIPESEIGDRLLDVMDRDADVRVGVTTAFAAHTIAVRGADAARVDAVADVVRERLGADLAGEGDVTIAELVVRLATDAGVTLATAESCTGGLVAAALTDVPGSSAVFLEAAVTYSNQAKAARLGVPAGTIEHHGAVSEPTVQAMAQAERERSGADLVVAISGVAGPGGGTPDKPVGTVVFGLAHAGGIDTFTRRWRGTRDEIRRRSVTIALEMFRRRIVAQGD